MWLGLRLLCVVTALGIAGCASHPTFDEVAGKLAPLSPNEARIFVYRGDDPYHGLEWVPVFFNGSKVGAVGPGEVIFRDVPPGTYDIAPQGVGSYPNQDKVVVLTAGEVAYARMESFQGFDPFGNHPVEQNTYVIVLIDPGVARRQIGHLWYIADVASRRLAADADPIATARE